MFATERLHAWGLADCADAVALLVSELVTNALLHARTEMTVAVTRSDGCVLVEVTDGSVESPMTRKFSVHAGTGRGLQLVDTLARAWGVRRLEGGKTIWAEIATGSGDQIVAPFDLEGLDAR